MHPVNLRRLLRGQSDRRSSMRPRPKGSGRSRRWRLAKARGWGDDASRRATGPPRRLPGRYICQMAYLPRRNRPRRPRRAAQWPGAAPADIRRRPWKRKWPHYVRVHGAEFIAGPLANGVALTDLMDELGGNALPVPRQTPDSGSGTRIRAPHSDSSQSVRLSREGLFWLDERFVAAVERAGRIPKAALDQLDWPKVRRR
jgi:hypothetical protein